MTLGFQFRQLASQLFGISPVEKKKRSALSSLFFFFFKEVTLTIGS